MSIEVIGAGFGRTGTLSLKTALERLGFGPCHHMLEVVARPQQSPRWAAAASGDVDWDGLLEGYRAIVDWPGCAFWRELSAHYPEARVVLTTRDPQAWYRSIRNTIYEALTRADVEPLPDLQRSMAQHLILDRTFGGRLDDAAHAIAVFERHNRAVREQLPAGRLLEFDVSEGWAPLCAFLGRAVPEDPFPASNTTAEFRARRLARGDG